MEELFKALDEMPDKCSSSEFCSKAREFGITTRQIQDAVCSEFLKQNAIHLEKRTYTKTKDKTYLEKCIDYIKSEGYKVFKPVTEYKEL